MTVKECYERMHGDYNEALEIMASDRMIEKFMLMFLSDETILLLRESVKEKNSEKSFQAAHTLKGVAANLGFLELKNAASALTEQLRGTKNLVDEKLYQDVEKSYTLITETLNDYKSERA